MNERLGQAEKQGRAFEDFALGEIVVTDGRTIDVSDISAFAGLTGDFYPLHVDEEYARKTPFGGRIAHGRTDRHGGIAGAAACAGPPSAT